MKTLAKVLLVMVLCFTASLVLASTADDPATCAITCTVDGLMEWAGNFTNIDIAEHITEQNDQITGNGTATLYTNDDVTITADNTVAAELDNDGASSDTLVTEYQLEYDGDGVTATGGSTVSYTEYDTFLSSSSAVTHISEDGAVVVTLTVRASNDAGNVADSGAYSATQTLTAAWAGS